MNDLTSAIEAKSDQLNADDLIAGPRTITITRVVTKADTKEQPVSIFFEDDDGKPYKPCKSMCRVMVAVWGKNGDRYVGEAMTLYRDPTVKWGGMEVGGIRISHMSRIDHPFKIPLTVTRGNKKLYTVQPLPSGGKSAGADTLADGVGEKGHSPPADVFEFTLVTLSGVEHKATNGEAWAEKLCEWLETRGDENAAATWNTHKPHVEAAEAAGFDELAIRVRTAARQRGFE